MSEDAVAVFTAYFGTPVNLYAVLLTLVVVLLGLTLMILITKSLQERKRDRDFTDLDVWFVWLRGLAVIFILIAFFGTT